MRKTIAVLIESIDHLSRGYEFELREAFDSGCRALDLNLLMIAGRALEHPDPATAAHNAVYGIAGPASVDGVIVVASGLASHGGVSAVQRLTATYRGLAVCSLGLAIDGIPSVTVDSKAGMEAVVEHIIATHRCSEIAYVGGPATHPDAQVRFAVFRQVMLRHGRQPDPRLVRHTEFSTVKGQQAVEDLLSGGTPFDAVIAANDSLGIGAIEALRAHGLRVPLNACVTGFDDLAIARIGDPPLTTVRQPFRAMADAALQLVMAQIAGHDMPSSRILPAELFPRESCGCGGSMQRAASLPPRALSPRGVDFVRANRNRLQRLLRIAQRSTEDTSIDRSQRILSCLETELNGERYAFLVGLEDLLAGSCSTELFEDMQRVVTTLRSELRVVQDPELEELWHETRTHIALLNTRCLMRHIASLETRYDRILKTSERFSTSLGLASLKSTLLEELPDAQVNNAFISLYSGGDRSSLAAFFCLREGSLHDPQPAQYQTQRLFPAGQLHPDRRYTWIILPLVFESECLGVAGFEMSASIVAYEMFRDRISAALKTASMHHEIVRQTAAQERSNQERLATAERLKSLSVLAGGVAHDLNNALGPLVALPDVISQALLDQGPDSRSKDTELLTDLATIKSAAIRATQTIKDLLTLGRQHRVSKETIDLNEIVANCTTPRSQDIDGHTKHNVSLQLTLATEQLFVSGSEVHLVRAVSNLIGNALEATSGEGTVCVGTAPLRLTQPLEGYEVIEPGDYATVSVRDTGPGIPPDMIRRIFEPFFSRKRLHDSSGSGLGLAIVHGVVKEHDGFINVESTVGSGSVFTLYLPRVPVAQKLAQSLDPLGVHRSGRILVVDDDPTQLRTACRILARAGYNVRSASSAGQAYEMFLRREASGRDARVNEAVSPFDLVILDMLLDGERDGLDVFEQIRKLVPSQRGILVSGHAPMERGALALERGMAWLAKPYTAESLVRIVQRTLPRPEEQPPERRA